MHVTGITGLISNAWSKIRKHTCKLSECCKVTFPGSNKPNPASSYIQLDPINVSHVFSFCSKSNMANIILPSNISDLHSHVSQ